MKRLLLLPALLVCGFAHAQVRYHVTDLGTLGGAQSEATSVNAQGQIVGWSWTGGTGQNFDHAFLFSNGVMQDLGTFGGLGADALGINNSGQIAGQIETAAGPYHAFLYSAGTVHDLGTLGGSDSTGFAVNDLGQVVGESTVAGSGQSDSFLYSGGEMQDLGNEGAGYGINDAGYVVGSMLVAGNHEHAYIYSNGNTVDLGTLGGSSSAAFGINQSGEVVGESSVSGNGSAHAFIYENGTMLDLGTLGGDSSTAYAINGSGQVVGLASTSSMASDPFIYSGGTMHDLYSTMDSSSAGVLIYRVASVNDSGLIVGFGTTSTSQGNVHALLLTPIAANVTLPSSYSILIGARTSGSLYSIQFNDTWYLTVLPGVTTLLSQPPVQVQLSGTSPTMNPASFQFTFTGHVNSINLSQTIQLYNFNTSSYETLGTTGAHVGSDSTVTVTPTGDLTRFVNQSTGEVRAKVNFSRAGATSVIRWTASLGVANWIIQ